MSINEGDIAARGQKPVDPSVAERRAHRRKPTLWEARLDTEAGIFTCVVLNVSQGGAMIQAEMPLVDSSAVTLTIERLGTLRAEVVWQIPDDGRLGVRFTEPPERISRVLAGMLPL